MDGRTNNLSLDYSKDGSFFCDWDKVSEESEEEDFVGCETKKEVTFQNNARYNGQWKYN